MAKRGCNGGDEAQPLPSASFSSLPDIAHDIIASFLPDGDYGQGNRLHVSEVSRSLRGFYDGTDVRI